ncbi:hypothetical protein RF11_12369 [Thelohanellus kitauei]|uniref:Uncharacterized protein n=1 Tax=Thelohanellus kitauei TaxID=669202 RepID=A0A0C2NFV6_THEKT|nr:hypothetical protein RF11_12369 [Thelohanellus kitauei]
MMWHEVSSPCHNNGTFRFGLALIYLARYSASSKAFSGPVTRSDFPFYSLDCNRRRPIRPRKTSSWRKERGSITSPEGQAAKRALKTEKPQKGSSLRHDRWHSYRPTKAWSMPLRYPDSCATAVATGVESPDAEGWTSFTT